MSTETVLLRLGIALALSLFGVVAYLGWNKYQLRRLSRSRSGPLRGLETIPVGVPGILYFTTPDCQVCITTQKPALQRLATELGDGLQIVEVDATVQPELADYWGVLSVPTTFVIDGQGQPRHINHGLTGTEKLRRQIEDTRQPGAAQPVAGAKPEHVR